MANTPVVEFFIQNYMADGTLVTEETRFQTIPIEGTPSITTPKVKNEMGKAGSFEFGLERNSPLYNSLLQMKTIMRVTYFGHTVFHGRVLTIDKTMARTRTVHCEGDFAFFLDTPQKATKEETRPTITVNAYLNQIIDEHNSRVSGDPIKQFTLGEVPGQYTSATASSQRVKIPSEKAKQQFGDTSWNTTMDRLEDLLGTFGGFFRTRYDAQSSITYLDWYDKYYNSTENTQTIEVAKNLIDISGSTEIENLFTIVIPIGRSDSKDIYISNYWPIVKEGHSKVPYIRVPELATIPLYSDSELNAGYHRKADFQNAQSRYGKIWKTVSFENANTPEKLFAYAKDWIKNNFAAEITQWSVSALDMKVVDPDAQVLLCGDRVRVKHPEIESEHELLTIISAEYDLYNPDKDKYTIGIPNPQLNTSYGVKNKTGKKSKNDGITSPSGPKPPPSEPSKDVDAVKRQLEQEYISKTESHKDIGLDDPLAYLRYNTDGTRKDPKESTKAVIDTLVTLDKTYRNHSSEIRQEAIIRGVDPHDTQLLIDFNLGEKIKQNRFKSDAAWTMVNKYNMDPQYPLVLLNERSDQVGLTSLVDDEGNWTPYALSQGASVWANQDRIKQMALDTRKLLNNDKAVDEVARVTNLFQTDFFGENLNLGNYMNLDLDLKQFDLGNILNTQEVTDSVTGLVDKGVNFLDGLGLFKKTEKPKTSGSGVWQQSTLDLLGVLSGNDTEGGTNEYTLESPTAKIDGTQNRGSASFGSKSHNGLLDGWQVTLNKPITYTANGKTYTVPIGSLAADDVHFTATYDSLRAKLLVVDTLVADYANIRSLTALKARIDNLTGDTMVADTVVRSENGWFSSVNAGHYYINAGSGAIPVFVDLKGCYNSITKTDNANGTVTLTLHPADGSAPTTDDIVTFNRAVTSVDWSWSSGTLTVTPQPTGNNFTLGYLSTGPKQDSDGEAYETGNTWYVPINMQWGNSGQYTESTGYRVYVDASARFEAGELSGWNAAVGKAVIPGSAFGTSITPKWPAATKGEQDSRTYTLSDDGNNAVKLTFTTTTGGTENTYTAAKWTHNKYTFGQTSVGINSLVLGNRSAGDNWDVTVNLSPTSLSSKSGTINLINAGEYYRTGYTRGTFTQASVDVIDTSTKKHLVSSTRYKAGSAKSYRTVSDSITANTLYKGDGGSFTVQGDSVSVTPIGNAVHFKRHPSTDTVTGSYWYEIVSKESDATFTRYVAGSATTYYKQGTTTKTARGNSVTVSTTNVTVQGSSDPVYVEMSSGGYDYYKSKTDSTSYWTKS